MTTRTAKKLIDKLAWICIRDKRVLSVRSHGKDAFYMPGGKRDGMETDSEALTREIKEELSVDLIPETIKFASSFEAPAHGKPAGVMVRLTCYYASFDNTVRDLRAANEIAEFDWLGYATDKEKLSKANLLAFEWLKKQDMIV